MSKVEKKRRKTRRLSARSKHVRDRRTEVELMAQARGLLGFRFRQPLYVFFFNFLNYKEVCSKSSFDNSKY